ncbi:hypothetical protein HMPREF3224_01045, partial [Anaerococcus hydrogenalis]
FFYLHFYGTKWILFLVCQQSEIFVKNLNLLTKIFKNLRKW